ncbi:MAPEG family protein [Picosynechococcus sp. PCC 7003]|uniref:MAPEG family protein n=1 Tax=Picosynechococcus sp. PCC 7003 TaxID=374981 RepID=UPI000810DD13|nr:MAPEG family protein [Picosynechococcus sp. PCC 7003]ANV84450.1 MAPEG family protein [Picosynechococcus sp. PCC 7003]
MNLSVAAVLIYSLVGAVFLVYLPYGVVGYARVKLASQMSDRLEMFRRPRATVDLLPDYAQRANWAHQNAFEALAVYSVACLSALVTGVDSPWAMGAAIAFLVARTFYPLFYILNIPVLRSMMFAVGNIANITLFALSVIAVQGL